MNDIEKILGEMEAYVEMHAKGWGSKDAAKDHLSQHALCYSATQYLPRLIAAVRILVNGIGAVADLVREGQPCRLNFAAAARGRSSAYSPATTKLLERSLTMQTNGWILYA
jgi:hypothetical protein